VDCMEVKSAIDCLPDGLHQNVVASVVSFSLISIHLPLSVL